jgi:hypothetical protein
MRNSLDSNSDFVSLMIQYLQSACGGLKWRQLVGFGCGYPAAARK